ncbi:MAG: MlaD family protein [Thermodesulfobacteriota bacterium]|nr:MlaD family protein [Thermodesulfobacteriota bacterium]
MESRINYTIVGLFVVLFLAGLIAFAYWLGKYGYKQEYDHYLVYMTESVAGLSSDASVKYRGVEVGIVEQMGFNPKNSEQVKLLLRIKHGTQVKVDTTAGLKFFGITGLAFIELTGGSKDAPLLKKTDGEIAVIPTRLSTYARLNESLTILAGKSAQVLDKFDRLLSEENLQNIAAILSEMKMLSKDIRKQLEGFQHIVDSTLVMEADISGAFEKVESASLSVEKMAGNLEKNYANVGHDVSRDVRQSLELFNQLLYDLDILVGDLQRTTRAIENSPGDLLFKQSRPRPGPGEEGYREK